MEEKERYSLEEFDDIDWELAIVDNELGKSLTFEEIKNLLNLQGKENQKLCQQIVDLNKENNKLREFRDDILRVQAEPYQFYKEIQQLRQSQKQLAISEIEKTKMCCEKFADELYDNLVDTVLPTDIDKPKREAIKFLYLVSEFIDNQIKKLKGEMCEKK